MATGALLVSLLGTLGAQESRLRRHDVEDLLAAGITPSTVEAILRETRWKTDLSDGDLARLKARGLGDGTLALLRERRAAPSEQMSGSGPVVEVGPSEAPPRAPAYASSRLGPCLCGDDRLCVEYCLALSGANRGLVSPLFFGGGHPDHDFGGFIDHDHPHDDHHHDGHLEHAGRGHFHGSFHAFGHHGRGFGHFGGHSGGHGGHGGH